MNRVDRLTPDGRYLRALGGAHPVVAEVRQVRPDLLAVTLHGPEVAHRAALATVRTMLGADRDLSRFMLSARRITWLAPLARRMRGVKPPRYPTLWEACVNAVVFQQLSVVAASAITARLVASLSAPIRLERERLYSFPSPAVFMAARDRPLLALGLSAGKLATLRRAADAIASGRLDASALALLPSEEAARALQGVKGIGPWSAALILLRGFGRLDVFPAADTSVARNLALVGGARGIRATLDALGPDRGMLYYHLLLARLGSIGDLGRASS
ncbi:MAG: DNA-3-methyladenine glycosylase 2 family protein [Chloroflexota bacterium]|nr:DNA-3-methyladenine glycosylase 2 family protein [Chloroflexota bacterium]